MIAGFLIAFNAQQPAGSIVIPKGAHVVLQAKGDGVQIYSCLEGPDGARWALKGPDAKLINDSGQVIGLHFAGPTWKLNDGGQIQGESLANKPSPDAGSIPWLLLRAKSGTPTGSLGSVSYIQRTETHGGAAPASGCQVADAGKTVKIPYTATYTFYTGK